ncbi:MAG: hypothetical protein COV74_03510 [Candidatus Omnitrophica bacterium CG11_big_fil_rev_8_21_14_0_20_45_26]|uniref:DUF6161 domain-containing protein n=1 Tax=Candidatus Abzuiibacterium crystallinum TaxID=1974748 RepID=A0A2H0LQU2_9BACT|nr:MAG: hypothetical protein COV74_03510 [Candidatus Omnitrophica bacterium CG11_big_fil_rev_8_21_14_0_20_45_26]PIW63349.1 MAG: hypothetical protein COW12_10705 [Candidatus Omnitrophica bacterium CG12_big_fil_rev_8_21_14_0_65_45_16]
MPDFRLEVDLKPNGNVESFKSIEEVQAWLKRETDIWNWSEGLREKNPEAFQCFRRFLGKLDDLNSTLTNTRNAQNNERGFRNHIEELKRKFEDYYKNRKLIHSSTPRAKHIKEISSNNPIHATYVLSYFTEKFGTDQNKRSEAAQLEGAFDALLFDWNIKDGHRSHGVALEDARSLWADHLKKSRDELETTVNKNNDFLKSSNEQREEQKKQFETFMTTSQVSRDELIDKTKKRFEEFEEIYNKKLALHSAITYWRSKEKSHSLWGVGFTVAVAIVFGLVGWGLFISIHQVVGDATIETVQVWKLGLLMLIATIGVWTIRVLIRLLLSNIHLASDAGERRTMLLTYLALLREGGLPEGEVKNLILQALFRPSSTGIVRDDAAPPWMAEWLKRTTGTD